MYKRILLAVDGSFHSRRAAKHAAHLASFNKESFVEIVYVLEHDRSATGIFLAGAQRDELQRDKREQLSPIENVFKQKEIAHQLIIKQGDPRSLIVDFANRGGFDLVILGSRGLNAFQEILLGSVSHQVAKKATIPVLIVK